MNFDGYSALKRHDYVCKIKEVQSGVFESCLSLGNLNNSEGKFYWSLQKNIDVNETNSYIFKRFINLPYYMVAN